MKIPTPEQVGLPEKFSSWRSGQEEAINLMLNSTKRTTALCVPTGKGKSPIAIAAALLSKKPTCIVTNSRGLQDQYLKDFGSIGLVDIRGRNNYKCDARPDDPDYTCEHGYATRCPYKGSVACPSSQAEMRAAASNLVVTNYAKWCSSRRFGQGMSHFTQVIFDEGHCGFDALAQAMQVTLYAKEIEEGLKMDFLEGHEADDMMYWKSWAITARATAEGCLAAAQARIAGLADPKPAWVKHFTHMRNLTRRLATIATSNPNDWIVERVDKGYQFDPIRPGRYAESALLLRVPKVMIISATLRPKSMYIIGIGKENFDFKEFDSDFDPKRCPIYYVPTQRVDARNPDMSLMWNKLDQFMSPRKALNGIVHTISYPRQEEIMATSRHSGRMIINVKGEDPTVKVEEFKNSRGKILVSPSVGMGYDFPDDECRWQFICKVPFEPPSKILKAREADDPEYRAYRAMQSLVQMFGRDMRNKDDWSQRVIADDHMAWFKPRYSHLAPSSFHAVYRTSEILPAPFNPERV